MERRLFLTMLGFGVPATVAANTTSAQSPVPAAVQPVDHVRIINHFDARAFLLTQKGERALMNFVRANPSAFEAVGGR